MNKKQPKRRFFNEEPLIVRGQKVFYEYHEARDCLAIEMIAAGSNNAYTIGLLCKREILKASSFLFKLSYAELERVVKLTAESAYIDVQARQRAMTSDALVAFEPEILVTL